jgi:ABC-type transporter Mla subunit MlaD
MKEIPAKPSQLQEISRNKLSSGRGKDLPEQKALFGKILEQFGTLGTPDSPTTSQRLPELEGAYKAATINLPDQRHTITEKISKSIELLDTYASVLSNPDNTLKQAYQILEDLSEKNRHLRKELDKSQTSDPHLEEILTHLTALVEVEQIKLNRGDYIDLS